MATKGVMYEKNFDKIDIARALHYYGDILLFIRDVCGKGHLQSGGKRSFGLL